MKMLFSALIALGFLAGAANATTLTKTETISVVENCGYGH